MAAPSSWVERFIAAVPPGARVLDVACGSGRHLALVRQRGLAVTGVDRDISAARAAFAGDQLVELVEADLEDGRPFPFPPATFHGVIVTNYLWRPVLPAIVAAVGPGGALIYETFRIGNERLGRPTRPEFLLRPGELIEAAAERLTVIAYEDVALEQPMRLVQRICAVAPGHPWIDMPPRL